MQEITHEKSEIKRLAHIGAGDKKDGFILWMV